MTKKLSLNRETLAELATGDLRHVVGAGTHGLTCYTGLTVCDLCQIDRVELPTERGCTPGI